MKRYWFLALFALLCLAAASVWMGGLNQDEGWYLYAANLVAEGQLPYRDFQFTQAPLLPEIYSHFTALWKGGGLLAARLFTLLLGLGSVALFAAAAARMARPGRRGATALVTVFLLGVNLFHLYYLTIPKTYALASLFVAGGFLLLTLALPPRRRGENPVAGGRALPLLFFAGLLLAFAAGTRISLGALLAAVGCVLLARRRWTELAAFSLGGFVGLGFTFAPYLLDPAARDGFLAAQKYHAARGGFAAVFTIGSCSRLVRWYLPLFILLGLSAPALPKLFKSAPSENPDAPVGDEDGFYNSQAMLIITYLVAFAAVFIVQLLAPFPYEDYQVPVMGLLAVVAAVGATGALKFNPLLLTLGLCYATAFGSPLLEKWTTNGQDRFWSLKKERCELADLRKAARIVEQLDPGGTQLLTQDLYLAIETGRKVPSGLEMGPFSILTDAEWRALLETTSCPVAALSGYTFAIEPPVCCERSVSQQLEYWGLLKRRYVMATKLPDFGQNATPLLILKLK